MSSHYYHYYICSICQQSSCCVCQQLEKQIEDLAYMKHYHFLQLQYWEAKYNYLRTLISHLESLQSITDEVELERQFHQFYTTQLNHFEKLLEDHKIHNPWHRYD